MSRQEQIDILKKLMSKISLRRMGWVDEPENQEIAEHLVDSGVGNKDRFVGMFYDAEEIGSIRCRIEPINYEEK